MSDPVLLVRAVDGRYQALSHVGPTGLPALQKQSRDAPLSPASRPRMAGLSRGRQLHDPAARTQRGTRRPRGR